jgi:pimeloyl-ACP methyl ester carboxylesterase
MALTGCAVILTASACGSAGGDRADETSTSSSSSSTSTSVAEVGDPFSTDKFLPPKIFWDECGDNRDCGFIDVPIDYSDRDSATTSLYIVRHRALDPDKRIGVLLVNPGGPGFGGSYLAERASTVYDEDIVGSFDIIGWDPRGTGRSIPAIDCIDDYDEFFTGDDITPDGEVERQENLDSQKDFTDRCFERSGSILPYSGTNNSARDMEMIRRALEEDVISYFGFSYGSELGAVWATMYPNTVRAAVFDGAADPNVSNEEQIAKQHVGFESAITVFLKQCSADSSCKFHSGGDAEDAFDALMLSLDETPIPTVEGRPNLTRGMALTAVAQAMYSDQTWDALAGALAQAQRGDGASMLEIFDAYFRREADGTYSNEIEAFLNITCADNAERMTPEEADAKAKAREGIAPRFSPGSSGDYSCTFWPDAIDPRIEIAATTPNSILVVGTTGDAATPIVGARAMVDALGNAQLLVVTADQHTGYGANWCAVKTISDYLVKLKVPEPDKQC